MRSFWWLSFRCCFHWLVDNTSKDCFKTDIPNLTELPFVRYALQSKVLMSATTSRLLQFSECNPMLMPKILLLTRVGSLSKKKKGRFFMTNFCHIFYDLVMILYTLPWFLWHHLLQRRGFWVQQLIPHVLEAKNEIYYSLLLFICHYSLLLFTCYCSLRNFAYLRGAVPYIWGKCFVCLVQDFFLRESFPLRAFLCEISLLTITSYLLYKSCNS